MKLNRYSPFAFIYFFVNAVGLPFGWLYTIFLTPVFYIWLLMKRKKLVIIQYAVLIAPFVFNHLLNGVDQYQYWRSVVLYLTVYIFGYTFYTFIKTNKDLGEIFKSILIINFILTIVAFIFLFTPGKDFFWLDWSLEFGSVNIQNWPRLIMFTYEASYYSTLLVPVFAFYFISFMLGQIKSYPKFTLAMITIPLVASFSMGVIGGLFASFCCLFMVNIPRVIKSKILLYSFTGISVAVVLTILFLLVFYPSNPFFGRIITIVGGGDFSANGRTVEAFRLAYTIADLKSTWWGIGFGQIKVIGDPIIKEFYHYPESYGQVSIPNTFAETFALFGYVGAALRLLVEVYLFFKTRVLSNYYRTMLFFYMFIYQFTGSYTTNIAEYVIWILAFTNFFPQFDKQHVKHAIPQPVTS